VPGNGSDGALDPAALRSWTDEVLRLLEEADRVEVGLVHVGRMLAFSPPDADAVWPAEAVRELLEGYRTRNLKRAFNWRL
jgi:hypothetical protein